MYQVACKVKIDRKFFIEIFEKNKDIMKIVKSSDTYIKSEQDSNNVDYIFKKVETVENGSKLVTANEAWEYLHFGNNNYNYITEYYNVFKKLLSITRGIRTYECNAVCLENSQLLQYYKRNFNTATLNSFNLEFTKNNLVYTLTQYTTSTDCYLTCSKVYSNKDESYQHITHIEAALDLQAPPESESWLNLQFESVYDTVFSDEKHKDRIELLKLFENSYKYLTTVPLFEIDKTKIVKLVKERISLLLLKTKVHANDFWQDLITDKNLSKYYKQLEE